MGTIKSTISMQDRMTQIINRQANAVGGLVGKFKSLTGASRASDAQLAHYKMTLRNLENATSNLKTMQAEYDRQMKQAADAQKKVREQKQLLESTQQGTGMSEQVAENAIQKYLAQLSIVQELQRQHQNLLALKGAEAQETVKVNMQLAQAVGRLNQYEIAADKAQAKIGQQERLLKTLPAQISKAAEKAKKQNQEADKFKQKLQEQKQHVSRLESELARVPDKVKQAAQSQQKFNKQLQQGQSAAGGLLSKIKNVVGAYLSFQAIKDFVVGSFDAMNEQERAEGRMRTAMKNIGGNEAGYSKILEKATEIQNKTTLPDEVVLTGASQLGAFRMNAGSIEQLMPGLSDIMAAKRGDGKFTTQDAVTAANAIGKAFRGQTDSLAEAGVQFTKAEKSLMKSGTEAQRVALLTKKISESAGGFAEALQKTPAGKIKAIGNQFRNMREEIGRKLSPTIMRVMDAFQRLMINPAVKRMIDGLVAGVNILFAATEKVINFINDNLSLIEPIIWGIAGALSVAMIPMLWATVKPLFVQALLWAQQHAAMLISIAIIAVLVYSVIRFGAVAIPVLLGVSVAIIVIGILLENVQMIVVGVIGVILGIGLAFIYARDICMNVIGTIVGAAYWLWTVIKNIGKGIANMSLAVAEFFVNAWNMAVYQASSLIAKMGITAAQIFMNIKNAAFAAANGIGKAFVGGVNIAIRGINKLIEALSGIPVIGDLLKGHTVGEVSYHPIAADNTGIEDFIAKQQTIIDNRPDEFKFKGFEYEDPTDGYHKGFNVGSNFSNSISEWMKKQQGELEDLLKKGGNTAKNILDELLDGTGIDASGEPDGSPVKGGKVDKVGKVDDATISDENLKYLKDIAERDAIIEITTLTPTVSINTGDIRETADVHEIIREIENYVGDLANNSASGVYQT